MGQLSDCSNRLTNDETHIYVAIIGAEFVILPGMWYLYDVKIKGLPRDYLNFNM